MTTNIGVNKMSDNEEQTNNQGKQVKSFSEVVGKANGELKGAFQKSIEGKAKALQTKLIDALTVVDGIKGEFKALEQEYNEGIAKYS